MTTLHRPELVGATVNRSRVVTELFLCALVGVAPAHPLRGDISQIASLSVFPDEVSLDADHSFHRLLVTGVTADGCVLPALATPAPPGHSRTT